jgi:hypothetical protein
MKFFMLTFAFFASIVGAEQMVRVLLNNGNEMRRSTCSAADYELIDQVVLASSSQRNRALPADLFTSRCTRNCAGYAKTTCRAIGCVGFRRDLQEDGLTAEENGQRELLTCDDQISRINNGFNDLVSSNAVSTSCKNLLNAPRNIACYDDTMLGEIVGFTAWNSNTNKRLRTNISNGYFMCTSYAVNIEAVVNSCVQEVSFVMTGPNGYYDDQLELVAPYSIFGDNHEGTMFGNQLSAGDYTLTATPDGHAWLAKSISFTVKECSSSGRYGH